MTRAMMPLVPCAPVTRVAAVVAASVFAAIVTIVSFATEPGSAVAQGDVAAIACRFTPS